MHTSPTSPQTTRKRRSGRLLVLSALSAGVLLAACSSSSSSSTTTTSGGSSTTTAADPYLAADLNAPAASLNGAGSTFVQPFFKAAFNAYEAKNQNVQIN